MLDVNDVLSELNLHLVPQQLELREELPANEEEARLLALLDPLGEPRHIDDLCRASGLPVATVSGALVMMELKGLAQLVGPMTYARARQLRIKNSFPSSVTSVSSVVNLRSLRHCDVPPHTSL